MIDLPTLAERLEMCNMYLKKLKLDQDASVYAPKLAQLSPGMSGELRQSNILAITAVPINLDFWGIPLFSVWRRI